MASEQADEEAITNLRFTYHLLQPDGHVMEVSECDQCHALVDIFVRERHRDWHERHDHTTG